MRALSTFIITAAAASLTTAERAHAQSTGDDTARSREIRQSGSPGVLNDSLFHRAERQVREGRGAAGRALVDTLLASTRPGSLQHAQALYWRASLAGDAAEAERGYRRVIVEYAASRWAGDALLNLAQLEMARGDQGEALLHLHRFEREHPGHESRARASFWLARLHFDRKNEPRGCAALVTARASSSPEDVELRNQIDYHSSRCIGVDTAATAVTPLAAASSVPRAGARPGGDSAAPAPLATSAPPVGRADSSRGGGYTVQVAAYTTRTAADALIDRLRARGYAARLASTGSPFRVRIGRYDTRAAAAAALQQLKAKGVDGFVTETETP